MKRRITPHLLLVALTFTTLFAQQPSPSPAPAGQKTLAATLSVYAFPTKGQKPEQQSADEAECYKYAVTNTGSDPFELQKKAEQTQQQKAQAEASQRGARRKAPRPRRASRSSSRASRLKRRRPSRSTTSRRPSACASRRRTTWSSTDQGVYQIGDV
jgi:hypothetical protein